MNKMHFVSAVVKEAFEIVMSKSSKCLYLKDVRVFSQEG